jgi:hypothetical protein
VGEKAVVNVHHRPRAINKPAVRSGEHTPR